jgi:hypothetical protein
VQVSVKIQMLNENVLKLVILFIVIFALVLGFMFLWAKTIERFLVFKKQIKPESLAISVSIVGILISTTVSLAMLYFIVNLILSWSNSIGEKIASQSKLPSLDKSDCTTLVNFVSKTQNEMALLENHSSIEVNSNLFTIDLEYQKGINIMQEKATEYRNLKVKEKTKIYTDKLADLISQKADYFKQRINLDPSQEKIQSFVENLLGKMSTVTEERTDVINQIGEQCKE